MGENVTRKRFKIRRNMSASTLANKIDFAANYLLIQRENMDEATQDMLDYLLYNLLPGDDYNRFVAEHPEWKWEIANDQETQ